MNTLYLIFDSYEKEDLPFQLIETGKDFPEIEDHPITIQLPYLPNVGDTLELEQKEGDHKFYEVLNVYHNIDKKLRFVKTEVCLKVI